MCILSSQKEVAVSNSMNINIWKVIRWEKLNIGKSKAGDIRKLKGKNVKAFIVDLKIIMFSYRAELESVMYESEHENKNPLRQLILISIQFLCSYDIKFTC